jgi:hypothetical protein
MNTQVETILTTLRSRELGLGWIADEIVSSIQMGKPSEKYFNEPGQKRRKKGQFTEPLSSQEEMETAINVLRNYFIEPNHLWKTAEAIAAEVYTTPITEKLKTQNWGSSKIPNPKPLSFQILDAEQGRPLAMFAADIEPSIQKLAHLLTAALQEEKVKNLE